MKELNVRFFLSGTYRGHRTNTVLPKQNSFVADVVATFVWKVFNIPR